MRQLYAFTLALVCLFSIANGQCNILSNATPGLILDYQSTNLFNCSGVGYNPNMGRYYAVRAGNPSFPLETWNASGTQLYSTTAGFDWRGMWWNPNTNQLEGNGYASSGMWKANLDVSGYALNTGVSLFTGQAQPDAQSCGDYDPVSNEVIYYFNGRIYRYSRATNAAISNYALVGCPVAFSNLNWTSVVYTGCVGKEIGVLDYVLKRIYLFQKNSGIYIGTSQLPGTAVTNNAFRFSWANGLAWLFDLGTGNWYSYQIFDTVLPDNSFSANAIWFSPSVSQIDWESSLQALDERFDVERSVDGVDFLKIGSKAADEMDSQSAESRHWSLQDATVPDVDVVFYRVKRYLQSGEVSYSEVMTLSRSGGSGLEIAAWPVPAREILHVQIANAVAGNVLSVYDAAGKRVFEHSLSDQDAGLGLLSLDCSAWAEGIYLLRMRDQMGEQVSRRIVVAH